MTEPIKIDLGPNVKTVHIYPLGDFHMGNEYCNMAEIKRTLSIIKNDPLAKVILIGDLIENINKNSVGNVYQQDITPTQQLKQITDLLMPIKHKIIGITRGNHEDRSSNDGIELTEILAYNLGLLEYYGRESVYILLSYGVCDRHINSRHNVVIYAKHSGGKNPVKLSEICDADIYIDGHLHNYKYEIKGYYHVGNRKNGTLTFDTRTFVTTTSYLNYGGYSEDKNYTPNTISQPVITVSYKLINKREKNIVKVDII